MRCTPLLVGRLHKRQDLCAERGLHPVTSAFCALLRKREGRD
jgi:hypothetical protein